MVGEGAVDMVGRVRPRSRGPAKGHPSVGARCGYGCGRKGMRVVLTAPAPAPHTAPSRSAMALSSASLSGLHASFSPSVCVVPAFLKPLHLAWSNAAWDGSDKRHQHGGLVWHSFLFGLCFGSNSFSFLGSVGLTALSH